MGNPRRRVPFAVHRLLDAEPAVALVRYDGDPEVFSAVAADWLREEGIRQPIQPPSPRLYRCNPDWTGEYAWTLGRPSNPGPGTFLGALIELAPRPVRWGCIDDWGKHHAEHSWSPWSDRPADMPHPRPDGVARWRWCQRCVAHETQTPSQALEVINE